MNPISPACRSAAAPESDVRNAFFASQASGKWQMSDPDGNWIDITTSDAFISSATSMWTPSMSVSGRSERAFLEQL